MQVYSNTMKDAPQLTNTWGSVTTILDFIFQDFAAMDFTKIETYDNGIAKITYNQTTNPLVLGQTIVVSGTVNYNKAFLVTAINSDGTIATVENISVVLGTASETGTFKMKLEACPVKKLYGGAAEQKMVVQFKNGWVCRVDDRPIGPLLTPTVTWTDDKPKFARIAIAEGSTGVDSLTGQQIPYNSTMPTLNIAPVNDYVSNSVFLYNSSAANVISLNLANASTVANFNKPLWWIVVDDNFMWFSVAIDNSTAASAQTCVRQFMVSEYDSWYSSSGKGMSLYAYQSQNNIPKYTQTDWRMNTDGDNVPFRYATTQFNAYMYDDSMLPGAYLSFGIYPMFYQGTSGPTSGSSSTGANQVPLINNKVILCDTSYMNGQNNIRGTNKYLTWVSTTWSDPERLYGRIYSLENNRYFIVHQYYSTSDPNSANANKGLIRLKVPK